MMMTFQACENKHVLFIIHWKLSHYTSYFLNLLKTIKQTNEVSIIDCSHNEINNNFKNHHHFYDHYYSFQYGSDIQALLEKVQERIQGRAIVISNSIRNELQPGSYLAEKLGSPHFLFEHLSSLVDVDKDVTVITLHNLKQVKLVFIPCLAIKPFFLKYKEAKNIHIHYLQPDSHFFSDIKKNQINPYQMVYAGRIDSRKKILDFINVNKYFFEANNITFIIIGSGEQDKMLQVFCEQNHWIKRVPQATPLEVQQMIDESIAVVIPSEQESYSMLAIEGLLRGTPVVMQNTGVGIELHGKMPGLFRLYDDLVLNAKTLEDIRKFDLHKRTASMMRGYLRAGNKVLFDLIKNE